MKPRTRVEFQYAANPWPTLELWARDEGYKLQHTTGTHRLYQKGKGFWVAPMMLKVSREGEQMVVEAWIRCTLFVRLMALMLLPAEMHVGSGGFLAVVPRSMARKAINKLLAQMQQGLIA